MKVRTRVITYDEQQEAVSRGHPDSPLLSGEHFKRDANGVWWLVWPWMKYATIDKTGQAEALARFIDGGA